MGLEDVAHDPFRLLPKGRQRLALIEERAKQTSHAEVREAEAAALMADRDPGDVQFDEESGEGDTLAVERDRDLALSAMDIGTGERSFVEVGTPVGMGSTILLLTFLLLIFANIPTISTIGIYSVVLIVFSLLADLFILPVLFIELIKSKH